MKYVAGCLMGAILTLGIVVLGFLAYTFMLPAELVPLAAPSSPANADVIVMVSDAYMTQQARARAPSMGLTNMQNLAIKVHAPNRAETTMDFSVSVLGMPLTIHPHAWMHFELNRGKISVQVDSVDVSGITVPQDIVNQQMGNFKSLGDQIFNQELTRGLAGTDLHIVGIEATEGALVLKFSH